VAILGAAFQALQRNRGPLLFFIGVATIVYSLQLVFYTLVIEPRSEETLERSIQFYSITVDIAGVAVIALAQTIAFSRIGRDVDRPMWRIAGDGEALKRFYGLWLLLGLASISACASECGARRTRGTFSKRKLPLMRSPHRRGGFIIRKP